ncbi:hypothetical protein FGO68_gene14522 [Halteria grandinella]|uniref:3-hydroxyanthranilate 3,4-dioxygenase n=1 Tax=Halteria grandinella TaxID=5974 RepID=A0A8J8NJ11_HALGN|nr:hypothetical protein FGO68_gene14522 [Halteria grandinella]
MEHHSVIDYNQWIEDNKASFQPPVMNKVVFPTSEDFIVMTVGGPNSRRDYHVNPYEEIFYQLVGTLRLNIVRDGSIFEVVTVPAGSMYIIPRFVPHSPQREKDSIGLVIEKIREEGVMDGMQWYCEKCHKLTKEIKCQMKNIVSTLAEVIKAEQPDPLCEECQKQQ